MTAKQKRTAPRRILEVLEAIIREPNASALHLSKTLDIPLPTIYRQIEALSEERFISSSPSGFLVAGPRFRALMLNSLNTEPQVLQRRSILKKISAELDETVSLSVPNGDGLMYFDRYESHWPLQKLISIGDSLPLHCSASGKLFLSTVERKVALEIFKSIPPTRHTGNSITSQRNFAQELDLIKRHGYAIDREEWFDGMIGAAVPIRNQDGGFCASLSTHSLTARKTIKDIEGKIPNMCKAAVSIQKLFFSTG